MTVELNSQAFKVLSSSTRVALLKKIAEKPRSLTSLAQEMGLTVQSTDEHLRKLQAAGFVTKSRHAKWVYYQATPAGKQVVQPKSQTVYILLSVSFLLLLASGASMFFPGATGTSLAPSGSEGVTKALEKPAFSNAPSPEAEALTAAAESLPADSAEVRTTQTDSGEGQLKAAKDATANSATPGFPSASPTPIAYALATTGLVGLLFAAFLWWRAKR